MLWDQDTGGFWLDRTVAQTQNVCHHRLRGDRSELRAYSSAGIGSRLGRVLAWRDRASQNLGSMWTTPQIPIDTPGWSASQGVSMYGVQHCEGMMAKQLLTIVLCCHIMWLPGGGM